MTSKVISISVLGFGAEHCRHRRPNNDTKSYFIFYKSLLESSAFSYALAANFFEKFFFATYIFSFAGAEAAVPDQKARQQLQRPARGVKMIGAQPGALKMRPWLVLVFCFLFMRLRFACLPNNVLYA